jgi:Zn-dependent M28 family amino/carboxypeptidase
MLTEQPESRRKVPMFGRAGALLALLLTATFAAAQSTPKLPATPIQVDRLVAHIREVSSDDYEGRGPGTRAEQKVVNYLSKQLAAAGVQPGGDINPRGGRKWTQAVTLLKSEASGPITASITVAGATVPLKQGEQIAIRSSLLRTSRVTIKNAPIVFAGYGVNAPERRWDDFKGVDVRNKILVVLINDPDFEADLGKRFDGKAMTYYGRWTYKFEEAARRGAAGVLVVHEPAPASYGWATVKNSNVGPIMDVVRDKPSETHPQLEAWIQRDVAVGLFKRAGLDFEAEKKKAQSQSFTPVPLGNATLSVDYAVTQTRLTSSNVVGLLTGAGHPGETVIYSAHWDHLGIGTADDKGDRIYNGARDNGVGIASVLELARVYGRAPKTDRSVVFMFVTAEEQGLLGTEYYARHPLYPLATTVAVFNIDALAVDGPARDVGVAGNGKISLQDDLAAAAGKQGRRLSPDPRPEAGEFYRSDHFPFAKVGVPSISLSSGQDLYAGGVAAGKRAEDDYNDKRYHQPGDQYSPGWDLRGVAIDVGLAYELGRDLANSRRWPEWKPDSEFKALRDRTKSARQ